MNSIKNLKSLFMIWKKIFKFKLNMMGYFTYVIYIVNLLISFLLHEGHHLHDYLININLPLGRENFVEEIGWQIEMLGKDYHEATVCL